MASSGAANTIDKQVYKHKSFASKDPRVNYAAEHSLRLTPVQKKLMEATLQHTMAGYMGAPEVTQFLTNYLRATRAKKVIEIGVFTGFSTLGFAYGLPDDGKIVACDVSEDYIKIGKPFWKETGADKKIDVRIQPAEKTLDELISNGESGTYDMTFIDADKDNYGIYYEKSLQLVKQGGLIAIDNVLWGDSVLEENPTRPGAKAIKELNNKLKNDTRIDITLLTIADGVTLAFKR